MQLEHSLEYQDAGLGQVSTWRNSDLGIGSQAGTHADGCGPAGQGPDVGGILLYNLLVLAACSPGSQHACRCDQSLSQSHLKPLAWLSIPGGQQSILKCCTHTQPSVLHMALGKVHVFMSSLPGALPGSCPTHPPAAAPQHAHKPQGRVQPGNGITSAHLPPATPPVPPLGGACGWHSLPPPAQGR